MLADGQKSKCRKRWRSRKAFWRNNYLTQSYKTFTDYGRCSYFGLVITMRSLTHNTKSVPLLAGVHDNVPPTFTFSSLTQKLPVVT